MKDIVRLKELAAAAQLIWTDGSIVDAAIDSILTFLDEPFPPKVAGARAVL